MWAKLIDKLDERIGGLIKPICFFAILIILPLRIWFWEECKELNFIKNHEFYFMAALVLLIILSLALAFDSAVNFNKQGAENRQNRIEIKQNRTEFLDRVTQLTELEWVLLSFMACARKQSIPLRKECSGLQTLGFCLINSREIYASEIVANYGVLEQVRTYLPDITTLSSNKYRANFVREFTAFIDGDVKDSHLLPRDKLGLDRKDTPSANSQP